MRRPFVIFSLCVCAIWGVQARSTTLPDACGNEKAQFSVKTRKNQSVPPLPAQGMAQLVFIEQVDASAMGGCLGCNMFTTRFGMDGNWVGAAKGNTYFAIDVVPGEHHLCAYWKTIQAARGKNVGVASVQVEAGKVDYIQATIKDEEMDTSAPVWVLNLSRLSEDEGKYHVKISALAVSKPKK